MKYMTRWTELYKLINENALSGSEKISFEFFLVEKVDIMNDDIEDIKDMIDTSSNWFAVANNVTGKDAKEAFLSNLRYIVGYYGDERATKWRDIISSYYEVR